MTKNTIADLKRDALFSETGERKIFKEGLKIPISLLKIPSFVSETTLFSQSNDDKEYQLWKASAKRWRKNGRRTIIVKLGGYRNESRVLRLSPV